MDIQENKDNKQSGNVQKNQKKNKNKQKKRLMSLLRGPKVDHKFYYKSDEEDSNGIKQTMAEIMNENSCLKLHPKKKKNKSEDDSKTDEIQTKTNDIKLTNELVFGLNSIIRSIEKKTIIGVIITNPLALPLEDSIIELCTDNEIPCISVLSLDQMKDCLNISSLSAIAFKPNVVSNDSVFNKLYQKFKNIFDKNCSSIQSKDVKQEEKEDEVIENSWEQLETTKETKQEICDVIIDKTLFDILYSVKTNDNYSELVDKYINEDIKRSNETKTTKDEFQTQESLIKFSSKPELYFPETNGFNKVFHKLNIILGEEETDPKDQSFAESLIDSSDEISFRILKNRKRKHSPQRTQSESIDFKPPQIVRLEPSEQRIKNRRQRKQTKKQNRCPKKS